MKTQLSQNKPNYMISVMDYLLNSSSESVHTDFNILVMKLIQLILQILLVNLKICGVFWKASVLKQISLKHAKSPV